MKIVSARKASRFGALLGLAILVGLAAGPGCGVTEPEQGSVRFLGQCSRAGTIQLFIDGAGVGSISGTGSATFPVSPGSHTLSARGGGFVWNSRTVTIAAGGTFTYSLLC